MVLFFARVASAIWLLGIGTLAGLLLYAADTSRGRVFAVASLLTAILPLCITLACRQSARASRSVLLVVGILWLATVCQTLFWAPNGGSDERQRVVNVFSESARASEGFSRFSLPNLVPEGDQLLLGLELIPHVDSLVSRKDAKALQKMTAGIYRELENEPDFHALGSTMSQAYERLWKPDNRSDHSYVYVPAKIQRTEPAPVLIFFHGSGGNFKAYLWILSKLADKLSCVLVAPSGGFGNWTSEESQACFERALGAASIQTAIDLEHVHIIGLSNGGLAITQLAANPAVRFESMTLLSPVIDTQATHTVTFANEISMHPVLVITGARDNRVPIDYVESNVAEIKALGAQVTTHVISDADHFALFSHREKVLEWMQAFFSGDDETP